MDEDIKVKEVLQWKIMVSSRNGKTREISLVYLGTNARNRESQLGRQAANLN